MADILVDPDELIAQIDTLVRPRLDVYKYDGGYDCCGCSTYGQIVDDIVAIIKGLPAR